MVAIKISVLAALLAIVSAQAQSSSSVSVAAVSVSSSGSYVIATGKEPVALTTVPGAVVLSGNTTTVTTQTTTASVTATASVTLEYGQPHMTTSVANGSVLSSALSSAITSIAGIANGSAVRSTAVVTVPGPFANSTLASTVVVTAISVPTGAETTAPIQTSLQPSSGTGLAAVGAFPVLLVLAMGLTLGI
ncbi:hypothetical protein EJ06DRAFT_529863 [Trichodelitschia bisporula]|uniref:Uncharacterized protein n=1 Tax=Trichodelitschia bisporula TaxID=703511 RepID=A0A6G1HXL4_9PEZI|nr:hypothetical protein EJ06DRAFT_529863 [Trichodelitschia bisporula]